MAKRSRKFVQHFSYNCSLTGEKVKTTKEAKNPDELVTVNAYYELNPEMDDRPSYIKEDERYQAKVEEPVEEEAGEETSSEADDSSSSDS